MTFQSVMYPEFSETVRYSGRTVSYRSLQVLWTQEFGTSCSGVGAGAGISETILDCNSLCVVPCAVRSGILSPRERIHWATGHRSTLPVRLQDMHVLRKLGVCMTMFSLEEERVLDHTLLQLQGFRNWPSAAA
eukprot:2534805-Amphidinium_carterae.1